MKKKVLALTSSAASLLLLTAMAAPALADPGSQSATQWDSTGTVTFTAAPDTSNPGVVDPDNPGTTPTIPGVPGVIAIDYASNLDFGSHTVPTKNATYYAAKDSTTSGADFVEMHDLRGAGTWAVTVTQLAQFADTASDSLTGAQLTFTSGSPVNVGTTDQTDAAATMPTSDATVTLAVGTAVPVMESNASGSYGSYATKYGAPADYTGNEAGGPISLSVIGGSAKAGTYTATLEYDLTATPANTATTGN